MRQILDRVLIAHGRQQQQTTTAAQTGARRSGHWKIVSSPLYIHQRAQKLGLNDACIAITGIASNQLPNGHTCHTALAINPMAKVTHFPAKLTATQIEKTRRRLKHESLRLVIIDEASHVNCGTLAIIEQRLCEIIGCDEQFGGLSIILIGDFF